MKKIVWGLLILILSTGCEKKTKGDVFIGMKGNVKHVVTKTYDAEERYGELLQLKIQESDSLYFTNEGMISRSVRFDESGKEVHFVNMEIVNGKIHSLTHKFITEDQPHFNKILERSPEREVWEQIDEGEKTKAIVEISGTNYVRKEYDRKGEIRSILSEIYNQDMFLTERKSTNSEGSVSYFEKCTYDNDNLLTEQKIIEGYPKGIYTFTYLKFDEKGNWTERITHLETEESGKKITLSKRKIEYRD